MSRPVTPVPTPAEKPPPFRHTTQNEFHTVRARPTVALLARNSVSADISSDGRTVAVITRRGAIKVYGPQSPRGLSVPIRDVETARLSADTTRLVTIDDERVLNVFALPENKLLLTLNDVDDARFVSSSRLRVYNNCQLSEVDLPASAPSGQVPPAVARAIGPRMCGEVESSQDGNVWVVSEIAGNFPGSGSAFKTVNVLNSPSFQPIRVLNASESIPITEVALSLSGDKLCALKADGSLYWSPTAKNDPEKIEDSDVIAPLSFDVAGEVLLFGSETDPTHREMRLVDFRARVIRTLVTTTQRRWGFLPGGTQFIAYGDKGADLYDMAAETVQSLVPRRIETDSFIPVPDSTRRFVLGQERRRSLDLYWIELP